MAKSLRLKLQHIQQSIGWLCLLSLCVSTQLYAQIIYCTPKYNFVDCNTLQRRLYIYNVQINNRTFSTSCSQAGYAGVVNQTSNGVGDPIVINSGVGYSMTVNTSDYDSRTYSSYTNQAYYAVWIDYNNNGLFDTYEQIRSGNSSTFVLYANSDAGGTYRMRIRARPSTASDDPCLVQDYGETEDYLLKIVPPTPSVNTYSYQYPCSNSFFTLSASGCSNGTIQWRDQADTFVGNNPASVQTAQNKSYYATCVINGTASAPSTRVYAYPTVTSPPAISSNNYNLNIGQSAALTATGCNGTVIWSTGQTGNQITVTPNQTIAYNATCQSYNYNQGNYCTSSKSNDITISVNAPNAPAISASKNVVCSNEAVMLSASGCAGVLKWSTGVTGSTAITVYPAQKTDYSASCLINGVEGAKATTTVTVNPATAIMSQPTSVAACEGTQTSLAVTATGSGNLTYAWMRNGQPLADSSATTPQLLLSNVTPASEGTYQAKITGVCGTVQSNPVTVRVSTKMLVSASATPANCSGDKSGSITITTTGGLANKQYRLGDQGDFNPSAVVNNLLAGTYTLQVRDEIGCTSQTTATVGQPDRITFKITAPINAKCAGGSDGAINVEATGGNGGYMYSIGGTPQSSGQFRDLKANTSYTIKVSDAKGCSETTPAFVGAPNQIVVSLTAKPVLCAGGSTGEISALASGGAGSGYQFQLDQATPQSSNAFSNLKPASYTVTVKDGNGCEGKSEVVITQPTALSLAATASLVSCVSDTSAAITATATGGTGPYQYQIGVKAFQQGNTFNGIAVGSYTIATKDANSCPASTTVLVKKAEPLLAQATSRAASCCTCADGSLTLTSSGGIGQKQYQLGQQSLQGVNSFTGLVSGQYTVVVRDDAGCPTSLTVTVSNATAATLTLTNLKNVSCTGYRDGVATVQVNGGKKPFTYSWRTRNPSDSLGVGSTVTRLPEGEFTVTALDSNRCSSLISGTLIASNALPPKPTITLSGGSLISSASSGVQWYRGVDLKAGKPVANANQQSFTPFESSPYFVVSTVNTCVSPASDAFNFILTALENILSLELRILPNPISQQLSVEIDQPDRHSVQIMLMDITGRQVMKVETPSFSGQRKFSWPLQGVSTGTYLLQAEAGLRRSTQRVVVN